MKEKPSVKLSRVAQVEVVRRIEQECFEQVPSYEVMEAAGAAVANHAKRMTGPLLCLAGPGNNGGDALVAARLLHDAGLNPCVWMPLGPPSAQGDASRALAAWEKDGGKTLESEPDFRDYCGVVDGLFGIGLARDLEGKAADVVSKVNAAGLPVLAIDVPSGIEADSGQMCGMAIRASQTVTFFTHKPGLLMGEGKDHAGKVTVCDLGQAALISKRGGMCIDKPIGLESLRRHEDDHKGCVGTLALVGGAAGMGGALALASRAAVAHGTGKVFAVTLDDRAPGFDPLAPEVMWRQHLPQGLSAIAFGTGAGTLPTTANRLRAALARDVPLLLDADGINLLARYENLLRDLSGHSAARVLTPHAAEAGRLLGVPTKDVVADRLGSAISLAEKFNSVVVLKGSGTLVAGASGHWGMVAAGNPGLAQAGSGDLLTGIIGALLAQGCAGWDAAATGAWLHAAAADELCRKYGGAPLGLPLAKICAVSSRLLANALGN